METQTLTPKDSLNQIASSAQRLSTSYDRGNMIWHCWTSERPTNSTIILLHGGFGSWTHWALVIPELKKHSTVIAADLPGLGESDDVPLPHSAKQLAGIVKNGIEQLLPVDTPFHLVGFSFGGMLGSLVAASFDDSQCLTFTAVGASGFGDLHYIVKGIEMPTPEMTAQQSKDVHTNNLRLLMFAPLSEVDALSLHIHQTNVSRGRIKSRRMSATDALVKALPHIKARIGGIWGELDSTGGGLKSIYERANIFRQHQPEAPFDIIDGAGHWVMHEQPRVFTKILLRQLDL
jgi:pimeloyl-ACP methyl ester carboxylesterase